MCLTLVIDHHGADLKDPPLTQVMLQRGNTRNTVSLLLAIWDLCHMYQPKKVLGGMKMLASCTSYTTHFYLIAYPSLKYKYPRPECT